MACLVPQARIWNVAYSVLCSCKKIYKFYFSFHGTAHRDTVM